MESVEPRQYPLVYHGDWSIDLDALGGAITDRTRAVVLVNPNNPTGSYVKRHELETLVRLCAARRIALISDEVFSDYAFAPDATRVETLAGVEECLAFSMSGLSKIAGLPQMKLGWIVASGPEDLRREAFEKLEWIADTYLSVSTPVQCAAARLLKVGDDIRRQIRERCAANLAAAREALAGSAGNILAVEGGWSITVQVPRIRTEEEWTLELLAREDVLVQPGFFYDFETEAFLIVSLLTAPAIFNEGLTRLRAFL
jgi:aspartate/methionine/tyrosine aminotransferase